MDNGEECKEQGISHDEARDEEFTVDHSDSLTPSAGAVKKKSTRKRYKGTHFMNLVESKGKRSDVRTPQSKKKEPRSNIRNTESSLNNTASRTHTQKMSPKEFSLYDEQWPHLESPDAAEVYKKVSHKHHHDPSFKPSTKYSSPKLKCKEPRTPDTAHSNPETTKAATRTPNFSLNKKFGKKTKSPQKSMKFEPYIPLFEVQQGLKRGEFIEGALRINPRNYEDAYVSAPDGQMDIYIGGIRDRNRAFNDDLVVVQVNPKQEWKVLCDAIKDYQDKHGQTFVEGVYSPDTTTCKIHTPEKFSKIPSGASSVWNEASGPRLPDSLQIIGMDKLAEQLGEISVQPKKKNRSKRYRVKSKNKSETSSKDSSNQPSSATSYSHGSSDDILSKMSSDNSPDRHPYTQCLDPTPEKNVIDSERAKIQENAVNGYYMEQKNKVSASELSDKCSDKMPFISQTANSNEFQNAKENCDDPWNVPDNSLSIITSAEMLLDFGIDNPLQQFCNKYHQDTNANISDQDSNHDGAVVVAPHDLSGDEFTDSASTSSCPAPHIEQEVEDAEFFASQQDTQNNNVEDLVQHEQLWNQPVPESEYLHDTQVTAFQPFIHTEKCLTSDYSCRRELNNEAVSSVGILLDTVTSKIVVEERQSSSIPYSHSVSEGHVLLCSTSTHKSESPVFKMSKFHKKLNTDSIKLKKKKKKKLKVKKNTEGAIVPKNDVPVFHECDIESLTVEEVMKHPLWPQFIQKTGKVVHILERKHSSVAVGFIKLLQDRNPRFALFSPKDSRLPRLMVPMSDCPSDFYQRPQDFKQFLYLARIEEWKDDATFASGRLIKNLGSVRQIEPQTEGILLENGVDFDDFPAEVLSCLPQAQNWSIPEAELSQRADYRKNCVFTIDPSTARDMDDAVSCELLQNGNYLIGVHIADVTYFVHENTLLDEYAKSRATSVYLVQKVIPMLPRVLCDDLCSLTPGKDRLTFSVLWELSPESEILSFRFEQSVINSCIKLSYDHAQEMIENPNKQWNCTEHPPIYGQFVISDVVKRVHQLHHLAVKLRRQRFKGGALQLNQTKLQFSLDQETGFPLGFTIYEQKDSNRLIEEFMLLANMTVAQQIYRAFPEFALLRRHPPPQGKPMQDVVAACARMGMHLDSSSSGALQASISRYYSDDELSQVRYLVLTHLCSKPMNRALYFCAGVLKDTTQFYHYALSVPFYTHFTSPIRRYPDIIVHRLLRSSLGLRAVPKIKPVQLQKQAQHCNDKKYNAKRVSEMSDELFIAAFILKCGPTTTQAMVVGVMDHSFDCLVFHFGIVKRVYIDKLPLIQKTYKKVQGVPSLTLVWEDSNGLSQTIIMFSLVDVILKTNDELQILVTLKMPSTRPQVDMPCMY